jgi:hypothetical protein
VTCHNRSCMTPYTLAFNGFDCKACGAQCPQGQTCNSQMNQCVCGQGEKVCNSACVNIVNSSTNCGDCGKTCALPRTCINKSCQCPNSDLTQYCEKSNTCIAETAVCPQCSNASETQCNGNCVNIQTDSTNCGQCGNLCTGGKSCEGGVCKCPQNQIYCETTGILIVAQSVTVLQICNL